jgi:predicted metal-dependent HD superfamily phosphohydrolase
MNSLNLYELTVSGFDDTVTYHVIDNGVTGSGFNWGSEYFEEKGYVISKFYSHQGFYDIFKDSEDHKPIIDFLIGTALVDTAYVAPKALDLPFTSFRSAIKPSFESLISTYTKSPAQIKKLWKEIVVNYTDPKRHYHTLTHLRNLMAILETHKDQLMDWEIIQFAIFFHDIVYDVSRNDNEEQSAAWAERVMQSINVEPTRIERCKRHILATKGHSKSDDFDTNLFTDADLSILGSEREIYYQYSSSIRQEYSIFPDSVYNNGRSSVLRNFLEMPTIYKTEPFQKQCEKTARLNLANELKMLASN